MIARSFHPIIIKLCLYKPRFSGLLKCLIMKKQISALLCMGISLAGCSEATKPASAKTDVQIPVPSPAQLRWQQQEQIMFVHLSPATWQSREYDDWSSTPDQIHLSALDTDQWCEVAQSWGAKMIIFVAKHCGGFCWWQTETSDYGIRQASWKNGKGDVMAEISKSCKKYGLDLGVYVYPGDEQWGAGIGSGGVTTDPAKQESYNAVYRQQLTELLTRYGKISEVWFDGNCHIEVADILDEHAKDAVIFQGKSASLRWVGNEDGYAPDPNWYTLSPEDLKTGVATALHSNVAQTAYAPVEVDVPLLKNGGHKWFWAPGTDSLIMTEKQLMDIYYKSVGRGSVLLLNSSPDTSGLIPASHVEAYRKFGEEINRRFANPVASLSGGDAPFIIKMNAETPVNHVILQENIASGQRVKAYRVEGSRDGQNWKLLSRGTSIGQKKIDYFPTDTLVALQLVVEDQRATPELLNFSAYHVTGDVVETSAFAAKKSRLGYWEADTYDQNWTELTLDLTEFVTAIGEYEVSFDRTAYDYSTNQPCGVEFEGCTLTMYGKEMNGNIVSQNKHSLIITRSQQTLDEYPTILKMKIRSLPGKSSGEIMIRRIQF